MSKSTETLDWLLANGRYGEPRIRRLGWKRLARIYRRAAPGSPMRKAIQREARRCGYTPRIILGLHS